MLLPAPSLNNGCFQQSNGGKLLLEASPPHIHSRSHRLCYPFAPSACAHRRRFLRPGCVGPAHNLKRRPLQSGWLNFGACSAAKRCRGGSGFVRRRRLWARLGGADMLMQRLAGTVFMLRVASAAPAYGSQVLLARWMGSFEFGIYVYVWTGCGRSASRSTWGWHRGPALHSGIPRKRRARSAARLSVRQPRG